MACDCDATSIALVRSGDGQVTWCYKCGTLFAYSIWHRTDSHADACLHPVSERRRGARWEWCNCCGAVRIHKALKAETYWLRPVGPYGKHPGLPKPLPPRKKKTDETD